MFRGGAWRIVGGLIGRVWGDIWQYLEEFGVYKKHIHIKTSKIIIDSINSYIFQLTEDFLLKSVTKS